MSFYKLFLFAVLAFDLLTITTVVHLSLSPGGFSWLTIASTSLQILATVFVALKWNEPDPQHVTDTKVGAFARLFFTFAIIGIPVFMGTVLFMIHIIPRRH